MSPELAALVDRALGELDDGRRAALAAAPAASGDSARAVFAASDFVAHACARDAVLLPQLIASGDLQRPLSGAEYAARAPALGADLVGTPVSEAQALSDLRRWWRATANHAPRTAQCSLSW